MPPCVNHLTAPPQAIVTLSFHRGLPGICELEDKLPATSPDVRARFSNRRCPPNEMRCDALMSQDKVALVRAMAADAPGTLMDKLRLLLVAMLTSKAGSPEIAEAETHLRSALSSSPSSADAALAADALQYVKRVLSLPGAGAPAAAAAAASAQTDPARSWISSAIRSAAVAAAAVLTGSGKDMTPLAARAILALTEEACACRTRP